VRSDAVGVQETFRKLLQCFSEIVPASHTPESLARELPEANLLDQKMVTSVSHDTDYAKITRSCSNLHITPVDSSLPSVCRCRSASYTSIAPCFVKRLRQGRNSRFKDGTPRSWQTADSSGQRQRNRDSGRIRNGHRKARRRSQQLDRIARSPWQNGVAEGWVGSCRRDLLDHVIPLNERHLKRLLSEYTRYYHYDRTHLGLEKDTPGRRPAAKWAGLHRFGLSPESVACIIATNRLPELCEHH
jgi:hypothetical protein